MVDVAIQTVLPATGRGARRKAQLKAIADARANVVTRVRVEPRDDNMRRLLRHPNGMAFRTKGSVEWPNDTFTKRRLKDGSVKLAEEKKTAPVQAAASPAPETPSPKPTLDSGDSDFTPRNY